MTFKQIELIPGHRYGNTWPTEFHAIQDAKNNLPEGTQYALLEFHRKAAYPFDDDVHEFAWHWPHDWTFEKLTGITKIDLKVVE